LRAYPEAIPVHKSGSRLGTLGQNIFQAQVVIHRVAQFLFASKVVLSRLHGCMAKQKLNLFKLAPGQVTESCAGAA
jgi:hypothetical protein